jgi:hypothetical protein
MAETELTFESIDRHIRESDIAAIQPGGRHHITASAAAATPAAVIPNVCAAYKIIRPILKGLLVIPFIPAPWKVAITAFINFMDALCP